MADTSFITQFQIKPLIDKEIADRVATYYSENITLSLDQQKAELLSLEKQLDAISEKKSEQAVIWFIRGLHYRNMASYYAASTEKTFAADLIDKKNTAYKQALALAQKSPDILSAAIYSTMKHGLSKDLKISATQNELAMGGNGESDSHYWYLHWSNIDQLKKAERNKEAENAFEKMKQELKDSGMDMSIYEELNQQIEKQTFNKSDKITNKPVKQQHKKTRTEENPVDTKFIIIISLVVFAIILLIAVTVYELVIKKKKRRKK